MFKVDGSSEISFIRMVAGVSDFWAIDPCRDYSADCQRGREAAVELQHHMCFGQVPTLLGTVARAISEKGRWTGLEVGFFHQLGEDLSSGAGLSGPAKPT